MPIHPNSPSIFTLLGTDTLKWMKIIALHHGDILNESRLGRCMNVSYHTVRRMISALESAGLLRVLMPFRVNLKRRLIRSPKVYIRPPCLLLDSTIRKRILTGFMIEKIISMTTTDNPGCSFFYLGGYTGRHIDLIINMPGNRIGFEFHQILLLKRYMFPIRTGNSPVCKEGGAGFFSGGRSATSNFQVFNNGTGCLFTPILRPYLPSSELTL